MSDPDQDIREQLGKLNALKRARIGELPACGFCSGKGDDWLFSVCSVCRGMKVDMGALYALRQKWGEVP